MQHVEVSRRFAAPPRAVWDVYTDHAGWKHWAGFAESWLEVEGRPERNGSGAVRGFGGNGMHVFEEVLDFEPPRRMTYRVVRGGPPLKDHFGEVEFEPDGDGTLVVWRCRFDSKIPGLGWLLRIGITRVFRKALAGLERHGVPTA
jgi:uncharacterized protein YndB with AHSA1/START domain